MNMPMNPEFTFQLLPLSAATPLSEVGGKAYNLGRLQSLGMPGARGFVIPDAVFQQHLAEAQLLPELDQLQAELAQMDAAAIGAASRRLQAKILALPLPAALQAALEKDIAPHFPAKFAVRSSAVGEDAAASSFAGQLDTMLDIADFPALQQAVRKIWASLYSEHCLQYARHKGVFLRHIGVVVQEQVAARWAGVLFSRDPRDAHSPSMLLEYCQGLGERLVSGEINPARIVITRDTQAIQVLETADEGELPAEAIAQLGELARLALHLETHFSAPQDIEWALDEQARLYILQARPITIFAPAPTQSAQPSQASKPSPPKVDASLAQEAQQDHWSNANIAENFPHPVTPFLYSIVKPGYSAYFRELALGFGLSRRRIAATQQAFEHVVGTHGGRLYYNLSNIHSLLYLAPGGKWLAQFFNQFTGAESFPGAHAAPLPWFSNALINLRVAAKTLWRYATVQARVRRFEARVSDFAQRTHPSNLQGKAASALAQDLRDFLEIRLRKWNDAALADTAAMVCYGTLKYTLNKALGGEQASLHNNLLKGLPNLISSMPVNKLWELAEKVQADAALTQLFKTESAETIAELGRAANGNALAEFWLAFVDYLEVWGFRSSQELTLIAPTPYEDPVPTLRVLQMYVREGGRGPEQVSAEQAVLRIAASKQAARTLSPTWHFVPLLSAASRFRILLSATQGAIALRERARFKQALLYTRLRHIALELGKHMQTRGHLQEVEDIFFLSVDEVLALVAGGSLYPESCAATIASRRDNYTAVHAWQAPDSFSLPHGAHWTPALQTTPEISDDSGQLRGTSACGGSITGRAVVALDVADAAQIQAGDILVTRQTDPGWAAVFFLIKGLVIERGGMLSHGAIIAREYGIPAVVGVPQATKLIANGQQITVDGDQGAVHLV